MSKWGKRVSGLLLAGMCCVMGVATSVEASESTNYRLDESSVGAGGLIQSSSNNFQASSSVSDLGVSNSASSNFQIEAGSQTTDDPALSFVFDDSTVDFGDFTSTGATTTTAEFSISNYTSYGYAVQIIGTPPSNGAHTIAAMPTTDWSQPGTEQFGINLVANTLPSSFGANPDHGQFGFGSAATNYDTPNQFRFVSGETIATAPKSSGVTKYTVSYLVNVTSLTPGGQYSGNQTIVVTGTY